jgi:hypothetical protein
MILHRAPALLQAYDEIRSKRHESGFSEFRVIHVQKTGCKVDIDVGEMECFTSAKSRQVKHDKHRAEDGTTYGRTIPTHETFTSLEETAAFSAREDARYKITWMNTEEAWPGNGCSRFLEDEESTEFTN